MPGDASPTLSAEQFQALYEGTIKPQLTALEKTRRKANGTFWLRIWLTAIVCLAIFIGVDFIAFPTTGVGLGVAVMLGYAGWRWAASPLNTVTREAKADVLRTIAGSIGVTYQLEGFSAPAIARFIALGLVSDYDKGEFEDLFTATRAGAEVALCDGRLLSRSYDNKGQEHWSVVFRGSIIRIAFPKRFAGVTVVRREAGLFNPKHIRDLQKAGQDLQKVGLGASQFEKIFEVYGSDQVESRYLVHPALMETLIALEQRLKGDHIRCAFEGGDLLIALDGKNRFEIGGKFSSLVRPDKVREMAGDVQMVMGVVDTVLAGPPPAYQQAEGASA